MGRKRIDGICHICGCHGKLSYEHVPPRAAFNDRPMVYYEMEKVVARHPENLPKGRVNQRGSGAHTLCASCNNRTGSWYGNAFAEWAYQGMNVVAMTRGTDPHIFLHFHIFPLRVIKQIVCMFFSANGDGWHKGQGELVDFVLSRNKRYIRPEIRIYAFYTLTERPRRSGVAGRFSLSGDRQVFSEISFPPIGYIMTIDSPPPHKGLTEISSFANYGYNAWRNIPIKMDVLPVYSWLPSDFRSKDQMLADWAEAEREEAAEASNTSEPTS